MTWQVPAEAHWEASRDGSLSLFCDGKVVFSAPFKSRAQARSFVRWLALDINGIDIKDVEGVGNAAHMFYEVVTEGPNMWMDDDEEGTVDVSDLFRYEPRSGARRLPDLAELVREYEERHGEDAET